ncbi:MAG: bifunctional phosphopantothenoylcysteine decarboxylase/phosphopantothenate--cysteine ligase CoaBC [Chthonomonadales bacterium]
MNGPLSRRKIVLGVTGSIAAYKAAELASLLVHEGADVQVVATHNALRFVGAATFRALTLNPVLSVLFDEPIEGKIAHIDVAQAADAIVVAPATANILAKMAHGIADDLLSTILLAARAPILVAPAMNPVMLAHPATQANLSTLRQRGIIIIDPDYGILACRAEGQGRMAEPPRIVEAIRRVLTRIRDYEGVRVVVTAGPTREALDPVRFLTNRSSGKMGYALAAEAAARGASVTLITGPTALEPPYGVDVIRVTTTQEMLLASERAFEECRLFIGAAAPADYQSAHPADHKMHKTGRPRTLRLVETPDILATLGKRKRNQVLVGFAAETEDLLENAAGKLRRKNLDLIVANDVSAPGAGFEGDTNTVTLLWPDGRQEDLPNLPKREVARRILDAVHPLAATAGKAQGSTEE